MDRSAAVHLIEDTFQRPFDEGRFKKFARELFNHLDDSKADVFPTQYIPEAFRNGVRLYKRIGQYTDPAGEKVDVMVVYLRRESALDRARSMQRNFITHYMKTRGNKETVVAAFVGESADDWRFSLVRMDYRAEQDTLGRVVVHPELTPARRFSFLVGPHEPNHTAQQQLLPILEDSRSDPTIAQLESAFNIESVTREFFEKYKELFLKLKDELDGVVAQDPKIQAEFARCQVETGGFAKKLLGQIVFLYFLQKKGWLGVQPGREWGSGSKNYLHELFQKRDLYENYFNDLLEPLFYEALAVERPDVFYPRLNCRIPFLNGGLFEPSGGYDWRKTDICIPNETFKHIFETFNQYNFTVREDEPLEREVAVDPEMLGKVFENLLEVQDRKSKGAFYTPREIVHYMCQEALINYLDTALNRKEQPLVEEETPQGRLFGPTPPVQKAFRVEEPQIVIPRGEIEQFIREGELSVENDAAKENGLKKGEYILQEAIRKNAAKIDRALAEIKICDPAIGSGAFPVGMMTEIVKARGALTSHLPKAGRTAYAFKRHAIESSIYGVDIDPSAVDIARLRLWLSLVVDEDDFHTIQPLPNLDYKIVCGNSLQSVKQGLFKGDIEALKSQIQHETDLQRKGEIKSEIDRILSPLTRNFTLFDFQIYFSEVFREMGGFDVVIANPPYVRGERIKDQKADLKAQFSCYTGTADLYVYFYERGVELLRPSGTLAYISSNKYFRSGYGEKLRAFLAKQTIYQVIDFGDAPVFDAIAYPSIIILQKKAPQDGQVQALTWKPGPPIQRFAEVFRQNSFTMGQSELKQDGWRLESHVILRLLEKLLQSGKPLIKYVNQRMYRGVVSGYNDAFIVDKATRDRLIKEDPFSAELLKPFIRGRDIKRWKLDYQDLWIIFTRRGIQINKYLAIKEHLEQYKNRLTPGVPGGRKPGSYEWYEIQDNTAYWQEFEQTQIVWGNLATYPKFSFAPPGFFINAPATTMVSNDPYLLGILNSRITQYLVSQSAAERQGGYVEFKPMYLSPLAIPQKPKDERISILVQEILSAVREKQDVALFEQRLNQEVYRLYNLSDVEIQIIEDATNT